MSRRDAVLRRLQYTHGHFCIAESAAACASIKDLGGFPNSSNLAS